MRYKVDAHILKKTKKCNCHFECQKVSREPCGKVRELISGNDFEDQLLVYCNLKCPYKDSLNNGYFCSCPTRIEIYKKYGV